MAHPSAQNAPRQPSLHSLRDLAFAISNSYDPDTERGIRLTARLLGQSLAYVLGLRQKVAQQEQRIVQLEKTLDEILKIASGKAPTPPTGDTPAADAGETTPAVSEGGNGATMAETEADAPGTRIVFHGAAAPNGATAATDTTPAPGGAA